MKLACKKCGTAIEVPTASSTAGERVTCPGCAAVYRLRRKQPSSPSAPPFAVTGSAGTPKAGTNNFDENALIAERYRVIRFLARGGMGEVYEVEDLELQGRLALKTILANNPNVGTIERFKREIQLARQVTHPNVCRIYDFGQHRTPSTEPVAFLTMELLRGETLAQHLRRRGRMPSRYCQPLVVQMADALEAAHRAGVVHRDLKSENIFLVPDGAGTRLVVTDFGIASGGGGGHDRFAALVTGGGTIGTPAYMAPEQVEGKQATPAADIYAFGVVLYEMVTGRLPFEDPAPLAAAAKRLKEPPRPPRDHVPDLDPVWESVILRCLALDPRDRFTSAAEAAAVLATGMIASAPASTTPSAVIGTQQPAQTPSPVMTQAPTLPGAFVTPVAGSPVAGSPATGSPVAGTQPGNTGPGSTAATTSAHGPRGPGTGTQGTYGTIAPPTAASQGRQGRLIVALLTVIALSAALWGWNAYKRSQDRSTALVAPRRAVAVLGFHNLSGNPDDAWLGTAMTEMLATELALGESLRVVPGRSVARTRDELEIQVGDDLSPETLGALRALLACDVVSTGNYLSVGDPTSGQVRLDLRLHDAASGMLLETAAFEAPRAELFDLVTEAGAAIRQRLGAEARSGSRAVSVPTEGRAAKLYAQAIEQLRESNPVAARDLLVETARLVPENALVHLALSTAWSALGYQNQARESAADAFKRAGDLDREDRLVVEGRYRETLGDWAAAAEVYRALWDFLPDNLDYGLQLAEAEIANFRPAEALRTIEAMRALPEPLGSDLRIDLAESTAHGALSAFEDQLRVATVGGDKARALGASLLQAQAEIARSSAQRNLGRLAESIASAESALALYRQLESPVGTAEALVGLGNAHFERGDLDRAQSAFEEARDAYRTVGNRGGDAVVLGSLALVLRRRGELDAARALYAEAADIFREIDNRPAIANNLNNVATLLATREELVAARKMFEESQAIWASIDNKTGQAYALANIAGVARRAGDLDASIEIGNRALTLRREIGHPLGEALSLSGLAASHLDRGALEEADAELERAHTLAETIEARAALAQILFRQAEVERHHGDFEAARGLHDEAMTIRGALGEPMAVEDSRLALARLLLDQDRASAAAVEARRALDACREQGRLGQAARAGAVLALSLLADGNVDSAMTVAREIAPSARDSQLARARFEVAIAVAQVRAASGDPEAGLTLIRRARQGIDSAGYDGLSLEARLAEAQITLRAGRAPAARDLAQRVEADATVAGFEHLRARAASLRR